MKKAFLLFLCGIFLIESPALSQEVKPTQVIRIYAYNAHSIEEKFGGTIPIYGSVRKVAFPTIENALELAQFTNCFKNLLFNRKYTYHIMGQTNGSINIDLTNCTWQNDAGQVLPIEKVACVDHDALCKLYDLAEKYQHCYSQTTPEVKNLQATILAVSNIVKHGTNTVSFMHYIPGKPELTCSVANSIEDITIKKLLTRNEFKQLKDCFIALYNHGIDKDNLHAPLHATPLDLNNLRTIKDLIN